MTLLELLAADSAARIEEEGWALARTDLAAPALNAALAVLAECLGTPMTGRGGRVIEQLNPLTSEKAHPKSLSAIHGAAGFPLHTDGAHHARPPRFIALACEHAGSNPVPTVLTRFWEVMLDRREIAELGAAPFLVRNGRCSFYTTISEKAGILVRYDRGCMEPATIQSGELAARLDQALLQAPWHIHDWRMGDILVVNNWRVLHGRGKDAGEASSDRTLLRVSIQ